MCVFFDTSVFFSENSVAFSLSLSLSFSLCLSLSLPLLNRNPFIWLLSSLPNSHSSAYYVTAAFTKKKLRRRVNCSTRPWPSFDGKKMKRRQMMIFFRLIFIRRLRNNLTTDFSLSSSLSLSYSLCLSLCHNLTLFVLLSIFLFLLSFFLSIPIFFSLSQSHPFKRSLTEFGVNLLPILTRQFKHETTSTS